MPTSLFLQVKNVKVVRRLSSQGELYYVTNTPLFPQDTFKLYHCLSQTVRLVLYGSAKRFYFQVARVLLYSYSQALGLFAFCDQLIFLHESGQKILWPTSFH